MFFIYPYTRSPLCDSKVSSHEYESGHQNVLNPFTPCSVLNIILYQVSGGKKHNVKIYINTVENHKVTEQKIIIGSIFQVTKWNIVVVGGSNGILVIFDVSI